MEWTKEKTIELVEIYRLFDILWDPKHGNHYSTVKKRDAWEEVAKQMGACVEECKKKMEYLLAALRREKMKIKKSIAACKGKGRGKRKAYTSSWFAFDSMKFLWDKNKPKPTRDTMPKAESSQIEIKTEIIECEEVSASLDILSEKSLEIEQNKAVAIKRPMSQTHKNSFKKKKLQALEEQRLDKAIEISQSTANTVDDSSHFGHLVAFKLRNYDENIRCAIQADILKIFIRASSGFYNRDAVLANHVIDNSRSSYSDSPTYADFAIYQPQEHTESHFQQLNHQPEHDSQSPN